MKYAARQLNLKHARPIQFDFFDNTLSVMSLHGNWGPRGCVSNESRANLRSHHDKELVRKPLVRILLVAVRRSRLWSRFGRRRDRSSRGVAARRGIRLDCRLSPLRCALGQRRRGGQTGRKRGPALNVFRSRGRGWRRGGRDRRCCGGCGLLRCGPPICHRLWRRHCSWRTRERTC